MPQENKNNCVWSFWNGWGGWYCKETMDPCPFSIPESGRCADIYQQGPDYEEEENHG